MRFFFSQTPTFVFRLPFTVFRVLERETGFEPATNSLEGCDSTPELLPLGVGTWTMVEAGGFEPP